MFLEGPVYPSPPFKVELLPKVQGDFLTTNVYSLMGCPTKKEKNIALMSMKLQDGNRACKDGALIHSAEQSPQRAKADLLGHLVPSWITVTTPVQQRCHVQHTSFTSAELISLLGLSTSLPDSVIMRYPENCITFFLPWGVT